MDKVSSGNKKKFPWSGLFRRKQPEKPVKADYIRRKSSSDTEETDRKHFYRRKVIASPDELSCSSSQASLTRRERRDAILARAAQRNHDAAGGSSSEDESMMQHHRMSLESVNSARRSRRYRRSHAADVVPPLISDYQHSETSLPSRRRVYETSEFDSPLAFRRTSLTSLRMTPPPPPPRNPLKKSYLLQMEPASRRTSLPFGELGRHDYQNIDVDGCFMSLPVAAPPPPPPSELVRMRQHPASPPALLYRRTYSPAVAASLSPSPVRNPPEFWRARDVKTPVTPPTPVKLASVAPPAPRRSTSQQQLQQQQQQQQQQWMPI